MKFEISSAIKAYLTTNGKIILNACPGSGKTTTIAYKLSTLVENWERSYSRFAGIACLSFTNTAKNEISQKYKEFHGTSINYPHSVSTIDNFINLNITLPHFHLLNKPCKRPKILEDGYFLDEAWAGKWKFKLKNGQYVHFRYPPSAINIQLDKSFSCYGFVPDPAKVPTKLFTSYCKALKQWQLEAGLLSTNDSAYLALFLLQKYPRIAQGLACRYPVVIIDEAQDTSEIQFAILDELIKGGLRNIEFVGDPYQCLYEWRNANPRLLVQRMSDTDNWETLHLHENRRSSSSIISCFSILRYEHDTPITHQSSTAPEKPVQVLLYKSGNECEAIEKYLSFCEQYKDNRVVVRGTSLLKKLIGSNTETNNFWKVRIPLQIILARQDFERNKVKNAVNRLRSLIPVLIDPKSGYFERKEQESRLKEDYRVNCTIVQFLHQMPSLELSLQEWTTETQTKLSQFLKEHFENLEEVDFALKAGTYKKYYDVTLSELLSIHSKYDIDISTIHQVKGMTFDSLLLILSEGSQGQGISLNDVYTPKEFPSEKQRLIYVAMSRPRHLLAIGVPDSITQSVIYEKFGNSVEIH